MRAVKVIAWLNLIGNLLIIATGGTVRLTQSGLGCTNAVLACSSDSFFATVDEGVHAIIEDANRGMSAIVGILAVLAVVFVWRLRRTRGDLWAHAWVVFGGVVVQAIVGPISIIANLDAWFVGLHYLLSAALVGVAASFVIRSGRLPGAREHVVAPAMRVLTHITSFLLLGVVVLGIFTTGSGPHSGDAEVLRDTGLWEPFVHLHSWFGYATALALIVLLISAIAHRERRFTTSVVLVIVVIVVQIGVGLIQARTGLPPLLVGIHMVLAALTIALTVRLVDATKAPLRPASEAELADYADDAELNGSAR